MHMELAVLEDLFLTKDTSFGQPQSATPRHTTPHEKEPHQTPESQELGVTNGSLPVARILMLSCGHSPAPEVRQASKAATLDYVPLTVVE
jgi:hypothetical protein